MTFLPCPGGCGRKVRKIQQESAALHCSSCIARVTAEVDRHATFWATVLLASLAMTGRWPEIDPSLLRSRA